MVSVQYRFKIVPSLNLMFEKWEGSFGTAGLLAGLQQSAKHPDFWPGMDVVADFTKAQLDLRYKDMRALVGEVEGDHRFDTGRSAMIVARTLELGMIRMFQIMSEPSGHWRELRIFSDFAEARSWLELPESLEQPPAEEMIGDG